MRRRYSIVIFSAAVALLFPSISGYSKNTDNPTKLSTENKISSSSKSTRLDSDNNTYVVRWGDSLYWIAKTFGTTPEVIQSANRLHGTTIEIGQKLRIPIKLNSAAKDNHPKEAKPSHDPNELSISASISREEENRASGPEGQPLRMRLVEAGFKWIGVRYRRSGGSEESGFDCSGLVKSLFSKFNIDLPRSSREQFKQGEKIERDKLEAGDLVFFSSGGDLPTHVGIYVGDNKFLHAAQKAKHVIVSDLNKFWYTMRYLGARRVMDLWWEEPSPSLEGN